MKNLYKDILELLELQEEKVEDKKGKFIAMVQHQVFFGYSWHLPHLAIRILGLYGLFCNDTLLKEVTKLLNNFIENID